MRAGVPVEVYQDFFTADVGDDGATIFFGSQWQVWRAGQQYAAVADRGDGRWDLRILEEGFTSLAVNDLSVRLEPADGGFWYELSWAEGVVFQGRVSRIIPVSEGITAEVVLRDTVPGIWKLCRDNASVRSRVLPCPGHE